MSNNLLLYCHKANVKYFYYIFTFTVFKKYIFLNIYIFKCSQNYMHIFFLLLKIKVISVKIITITFTILDQLDIMKA